MARWSKASSPETPPAGRGRLGGGCLLKALLQSGPIRTLALAVGLALALTAFLSIDRRDPPELLLFIGRFHPVIVHLPIGLLVLAGLLEGLAVFDHRWRRLDAAILLVLAFGSISAVGAVTAGYLLSLEGGYDEARLTRHMWLGIGVAAGAVTATMLKLRTRRDARPERPAPRPRGRRWLAAVITDSRVHQAVYRAALCATVAAMVLAGHQGGSLTHGPGYLTDYLPDSFKDRLGLDAAHALRITNIDSAAVYADLIVPIFEARCISCHGESKARGGLRLDTPEALFQGGDGGEVIVVGAPEESELVRRITLSPTDEDAMPPDGARPLDIGQTELIRWWIAHGASIEQRVVDIEAMPTAVATLLNRIAPQRAEPRSGLYALEADAADPAAVAALRRAGFGIGPVAQDLALLQVTAVNLRSELGDDALQLLLPVATQITWLDLGHTRVSDSGLTVIARMPNLTRLNLTRTAISDHGLRHLAGLENLEYLNLFGSRVGDAGLEHLFGLDRLESLYLWQTRVTERGVGRLKQGLPDLRVILSTRLEPVSDMP